MLGCRVEPGQKNPVTLGLGSVRWECAPRPRASRAQPPPPWQDFLGGFVQLCLSNVARAAAYLLGETGSLDGGDSPGLHIGFCAGHLWDRPHVACLTVWWDLVLLSELPVTPGVRVFLCADLEQAPCHPTTRRISRAGQRGGVRSLKVGFLLRVPNSA